MQLIEALIPKSDLRAGITFRTDSSGYVFTLATNDEITIAVYPGGTDGRDSENYYCEPIKTAFKGERQFTKLRSIKERTTFGYIFPISTLLTGGELNDDFSRRYAALAINHVLFKGIANQHLNNYSLTLSTTSIEITDLFPDDFALLILWKEQVEKEGLSLNEIKLLIQNQNYDLFPENDESVVEDEIDFREQISLPYISDYVKGDIDQLLWMISSAKRESSCSGKFLGAYQIVEYILSKVFKKSVDILVNQTQITNDPWLLKDKIGQVSNEKWRLSRLDAFFINPDIDRTVFNQCGEVCKNLLQVLGEFDPERQKDMLWAHALYGVRNVYIHRQLELEKCPSESQKEICNHLLSVSFELIAHYTEDFDNENFFQGEQI